jgi:hypothetical protein
MLSYVQVFQRTFVVDYEEYGAIKTHPLKRGGENMMVTKANRDEYVQLYVKWLLEDSIGAQFTAFSEGFHEVGVTTPICPLVFGVHQ